MFWQFLATENFFMNKYVFYLTYFITKLAWKAPQCLQLVVGIPSLFYEFFIWGCKPFLINFYWICLFKFVKAYRILKIKYNKIFNKLIQHIDYKIFYLPVWSTWIDYNPPAELGENEDSGWWESQDVADTNQDAYHRENLEYQNAHTNNKRGELFVGQDLPGCAHRHLIVWIKSLTILLLKTIPPPPAR